MAKSYKKAVINKCKECIYDDKGGNGNWRQQVSNCKATSCPLYEVRPLSSTHEDIDVSDIGMIGLD